MRAFAKSILLGTLVGATPFLLISVAYALMSLPNASGSGGGMLTALWLAVFPLAVALPVVLGTSIVIGLPLTAILKRRGRESASAYLAAGIAAGAAVPIILLFLFSAPQGYWLAIPGAISGAVTARTWWIAARKPQVG